MGNIFIYKEIYVSFSSTMLRYFVTAPLVIIIQLDSSNYSTFFKFLWF